MEGRVAVSGRKEEKIFEDFSVIAPAPPAQAGRRLNTIAVKP
jgi:hypothetical protein